MRKIKILTKIYPNVFITLDPLHLKVCCKNGLWKQQNNVVDKCFQYFASDSSRYLEYKFSFGKWTQKFLKWLNFCTLEETLNLHLEPTWSQKSSPSDNILISHRKILIWQKITKIFWKFIVLALIFTFANFSIKTLLEKSTKMHYIRWLNQISLILFQTTFENHQLQNVCKTCVIITLYLKIKTTLTAKTFFEK